MADARNDIARYIKGELTPAEMHALEKRALADPFLAEALEGASSVEPEDFDADMAYLEAALHDKTRRKKGGGTFNLAWPLRIAAGLLLLAVSTYLVFYFAGNEKDVAETIVLNKPGEEAPAGSSTADSAALSNEAASVPGGSEETIEQSGENALKTAQSAPRKDAPRPAAKKTADPPYEAARPREFAEAAEPVQPEALADLDMDESLADDEAAVEEVIITEPAARQLAAGSQVQGNDAALKKKAEIPEERTRVTIRGFSMPDSVSIKTIRGRVTGADDGLPIPGVTVSAKGASAGSVTDLNGNYKITVAGTEDELVFSYIGMETREVEIPAGDDPKEDKDTGEVNVQLYPDVGQLTEVVVVGYGAEKEAFEGTRWEIAEPEGGRKAYKEYLEKSLVYPEVAIKNEVEGKVSVQFTIQANGQLTDFRVVKSLGYGCDEEVIRLIRQGPGWKPTRRDNEPVLGRGKVKMRFSLPKSNDKK